MPSYGSLHSPSLSKTNGALDSQGRKTGAMRSISLHNIFGDPFALATISIAMLAWLVAFIGSVISSIEKLNPLFPNYSWFAIAYMLACILGVFVVIASDSTQNYHIAIVGFLSCGLVLTSSTVNSLIYSSNGANEAVAAGHILLSMVNIVWIFYFGSTPSAVPRAYLDSFAMNKDNQPSPAIRAAGNGYGTGRTDTLVSSNVPPQMYTSAQLGGFESSSPVAPFPNNAPGLDRMSSQPRVGSGMAPNPNLNTTGQTNNDAASTEVVAPIEYPYRAKAIYSYEANPDDANEISFSKHEILEVSDVSGRWWQAKKENGDTGIAPSNYLILL